LTRPDQPSGSDRIFEAVQQLDPEQRFDVVVNLQGDLPHIKPETVAAVLKPLADPAVDIATLAFPITDKAEIDNPNVVKVVIDLAPGARTGRAVDFSRKPMSQPRWPGPGGWRPGEWGIVYYHHVGIYAYRRGALARFVALPESGLERRERLEQLRALEAGMRIDVALVDAVPPGVDTPADLERARAELAP
jgi:3-deoxy-manno-octulosonate cytidylyltransferase (CMP-KDO synthetase)